MPIVGMIKAKIPIVRQQIVKQNIIVNLISQNLKNKRTFLKKYTGSSRLMRISLVQISLLRVFKTISKIWLMPFYRLFILLLRT